MVPLLKGNSKHRYICFIGALGKGFEAILEEGLRILAKEQDLLSPSQYDFRKKRSVHIAVYRVLEKVERPHSSSVSTGEPFMATMLHVRKAFNSLP